MVFLYMVPMAEKEKGCRDSSLPTDILRNHLPQSAASSKAPQPMQRATIHFSQSTDVATMPMFVDSSPPGQCIFCRLVAGDLPAAKVYEDPLTLAFMDIGQVNPGHVLVATKRHAATVLEITPEEAAAVMQTAQRVAKCIQMAFSPPGLTLLQANGREGDQTVFHFHMHVVPRYANDGIALTWPRKEPSSEVLLGYAQQLRQAMAIGQSSR
jgi:histidine triad (HIT) family protein